jgi:hypothetical protein
MAELIFSNKELKLLRKRDENIRFWLSLGKYILRMELS